MLKFRKAFPDKKIVSTLSRQLEAEYGRGGSEESLRHMLRFAESFQDDRIVSARMRQFAEARELEERIAENVVKLLEGE